MNLHGSSAVSTCNYKRRGSVSDVGAAGGDRRPPFSRIDTRGMKVSGTLSRRRSRLLGEARRDERRGNGVEQSECSEVLQRRPSASAGDSVTRSFARVVSLDFGQDDRLLVLVLSLPIGVRNLAWFLRREKKNLGNPFVRINLGRQRCCV